MKNRMRQLSLCKILSKLNDEEIISGDVLVEDDDIGCIVPSIGKTNTIGMIYSSFDASEFSDVVTRCYELNTEHRSPETITIVSADNDSLKYNCLITCLSDYFNIYSYRFHDVLDVFLVVDIGDQVGIDVALYTILFNSLSKSSSHEIASFSPVALYYNSHVGVVHLTRRDGDAKTLSV